jgi:hypothetical protein
VRSTGTDPFLQEQAHGIVIVDLVNKGRSEFEQAVMRERNLTNVGGQTMDIVVQKESSEQILDEKGNTIEFVKLLPQLIRNTIRDTMWQQIQAVLLQLSELPKLFMEEVLLSNPHIFLLEDVQSMIRKIITSVDTFTVDQWSELRAWESVSELLSNKWNEICKYMRDTLSSNVAADLRNSIVGKFNAMVEKGKKYIGEIPTNFNALCFEDAHMQESGGREVEMQAEVEQQNEQQKELEIEKSCQIQFATNNKEARESKAIAAPVSPCTAWEAVKKWPCHSLPK